MDYAIISVVSLLVAGLTFFSGFGLGTLLMPVFAIFFTIEVAIAATALVHLANNIFKVILIGKQADYKVVALFAIPGAIAAVFGALLLNYSMTLPTLMKYEISGHGFVVTPTKLVIAVLIFIFAVLELVPILKHLKMNKKYIPLGGLLSGFFGGLSGHQGALRTAFLARLGLDKKTLIGTMVISAVVVDVSRLLVYGMTFFQTDMVLLREQGGFGIVIAGIGAAFIGSFLGKQILEKMTLQFLHILIGVMLILMSALLGFGIV